MMPRMPAANSVTRSRRKLARALVQMPALGRLAGAGAATAWAGSGIDWLATMAGLCSLDPRVDQAVGHVAGDVAQQQHEAADDHHAHDDGIVLGPRRVVRHAAHAGPGKDLL